MSTAPKPYLELARAAFASWSPFVIVDFCPARTHYVSFYELPPLEITYADAKPKVAITAERRRKELFLSWLRAEYAPTDNPDFLQIDDENWPLVVLWYKSDDGGRS